MNLWFDDLRLSLQLGRRVNGCGDFDPVANFLQAFHDYVFAGLYATFDDPEALVLVAKLHGANFGGAVAADHNYVVCSLNLRYSALRHQNGPVADLRLNANARILARANHVVWIRKLRLQRQRTSARVNLSFHSR